MRRLIALLVGMAGISAAEQPAEVKPDPLAENCRAAAEYSKTHGGQQTLVLKDGKVVFEASYNGWKDGEAHALASGTKSFSGAIAAAAIEDGLLAWDEKVADTITEWKGDERKSKITVRQLLSLTSGIDAGKIGRVPSYAEAIKAEALHDPGTRFQYGPVPFQVFGELMRRKLEPKKEGVLGYLRRRILKPIGLETGDWKFDDDDNPNLPSGASIAAREWAKFGELVRNRGKRGDAQVVAWEPFADCFKPGKVNHAYGLSFWLGGEEGEEAGPLPEGFCMAAGAGKQRLYVLPSHGIVAVHFAALGLRFKDEEFLSRLLKDLPAEKPAEPGAK